jgi:hypothetical protein
MSLSPSPAAVAEQVAELAKRSPFGAARMAEDVITSALWGAMPKATRSETKCVVKSGEATSEHLRAAMIAVVAMAQAIRDRL